MLREELKDELKGEIKAEVRDELLVILRKELGINTHPRRTMIHHGYDPLNLVTNHGEIREARNDVERLEFDVERLRMIAEALWDILKEHHGYTDDELVRRVYEIDAADGALDGRKAATLAKDCPHCHRKLPRKRPRCLYCGHIVAQDLFAS